MTTFTEGLHDGGFLISEANGTRSRKQITLEATGGAVVAGTVLGQIAANSKYIPLDPADTQGADAAAGILFETVDATADVVTVAIVRDAEVNNAELTWPDDNSSAEANGIEALAALGIVCLNV